MGVDAAKAKMLVEGVVKEKFAATTAYEPKKVAEWAQQILTRACEKLSAMEEPDVKFIRALLRRPSLPPSVCERPARALSPPARLRLRLERSFCWVPRRAELALRFLPTQ